MNSIGQKICESRKAKGLTQEELAELSNVNLRTIQRIENSENTPRGSTLSSLCEVLQLDMADVQTKHPSKKENKWGSLMLNGLFVGVLNLAMMAIFGFLTLDTAANMNSRVGAYFLSIFMPLLVVAFTQHLPPTKRVLLFGGGFFGYILLAIVMVGFPEAFVKGLIPSLTIALTVLYYGNGLLNYPSMKTRQ